VPAAPAANGLGLPPASGGQAEVVALLKQLVGTRDEGRGNGRQRSGRQGRTPTREVWSHVWQAPQEGFPGGASPSMDVSNIAGAGGASSRRGYGTYGQSSRYWQPESDNEVPR
jgi:hypothetical protein